ncbi:MAG TPA: dTDP-4-amino-4,6-dideoxygalactose transaminase [Clostridiaceae bacterium]|nr:dTDP-4-amino-4,6-dideoxygalactose transaminase [Clostridiaceae bacterium]
MSDIDIKFNEPTITKLEEKYLLDSLYSLHLTGDGKYTKRVNQFFRDRFGIEHFLLTTSGTDALELASLLFDLNPGDEVIVPSFTFSSTVNAFLLRGAKPVFCDMRRDTFNMDEKKIEELITPKTRAIYVVHYAGVPCEMDYINALAETHNLVVIEDAAQAVGSYYKGKVAGTLTDFGCYSFHATKNYAMGEGGALIVSDAVVHERAQILREKGTNRHQLMLGMVDKYSWHDIGSSFLPSDLLAAILFAQLERYDEIFAQRMSIWNRYQEQLKPYQGDTTFRCPIVPPECEHNAHMYNILLPEHLDRDAAINELRKRGIGAVICYVPLHSSPFGRELGNTPEMCPITELYASKIIRLPLHFNLTQEQVDTVCEAVVDVVNKISN